MTCADARLDEYLDGELAEADRKAVEGHLDSCAACREEIGRSRRLEALLRNIPAGEAPDGDRFLRMVRIRSRRRPRLFLSAAAFLIGTLMILTSLKNTVPDMLETVAAYARHPSLKLEDRIQAAGPAGIKEVEAMVDHADVRLQFAAVTLLFKLADGATRDRLLARYERKKEVNETWILSEPGVEEEDAELVPVAVSMALSGQDEWALEVLRKLNVFNVEARRKVVESVVTLLKSDQARVQKLAFDIVKELEMEFPLSAVVDLLDSPALGDEALRFLRKETKQDLGKNKEGWRKVVGR
jgi:anti-sigma factor RsiW